MNDMKSERQPAETGGWAALGTRCRGSSSSCPRAHGSRTRSSGRREGAAWGVVVEEGRVVGSVTVSDLAACWDVSARAAQAWWSAPARIGRGQLHVADVCTTETPVGADESLIVAPLRMDDAGAGI